MKVVHKNYNFIQTRETHALLVCCIRNISLNLMVYFIKNFLWVFFMGKVNFPRPIFFLLRKEAYLDQVGKSVYSFWRFFKREIHKEWGLKLSHTLLMKYSSQILDLPFSTFEMQLIRPFIKEAMPEKVWSFDNLLLFSLS